MKNVTKSVDNNKYGYSYRQRVFAWLALFGIFFCGVMAGAFIWQTKTVYTAKSGVQSNLSACQMREHALLAKLYKNIDDSAPRAYEFHEYNVNVYANLYRNGCPENREEYAKLAESELGVAKVLNDLNSTRSLDNDKPCQVIESTLLQI